MEIGNFVTGIIYSIFFIMSIVYFYLFKRERVLIHLYLSLVPTFFCIYLLMNYHHYQPIEGAWVLALLMFISLISVMLYWLIYAFWRDKK